MSFGYAVVIRHVLAQPGVRKVEAGAPWAVGSAVASTRVQGWGDEPCEPTVRLPD